MMDRKLPEYTMDFPPQCLLVGNGINRVFSDSSWEGIIEDELRISSSPRTYAEIKDMPVTMQIVVATNDKVDGSMKRLSQKLLNIHMTSQRMAFLQTILDLPVDDFLTTNYSFELEASDGMKMSAATYSRLIRRTRELSNREKQFRLCTYYPAKNDKRIWHIHGDIAKPATMLMGHYYYAKQLRAIQDCVAALKRRTSAVKDNSLAISPENWVDFFLLGDVYILGFGMYLCESDLWYLACCKKRNYPESQVYFYDLSVGDLHRKYMLDAYGIRIITGEDLSAHDYPQFYPAALRDIETKARKRKGMV